MAQSGGAIRILADLGPRLLPLINMADLDGEAFILLGRRRSRRQSPFLRQLRLPDEQSAGRFTFGHNLEAGA